MGSRWLLVASGTEGSLRLEVRGLVVWGSGMAMTAESWQLVKSIFQAALEHDAANRGAYLDAACGADAAVRREVESLIASHESAGSFIELPAFQAAANLIVDGAAEATISSLRKSVGVDPVVGWLVCVQGPDCGQDYRIRSRRNFIGRSPEMDICIASDRGVSRNKHAIISYDRKKNAFKLIPGGSNSLLYLNDEELEVPSPIQSYDRIELGETELVFVPFCGARFQW